MHCLMQPITTNLLLLQCHKHAAQTKRSWLQTPGSNSNTLTGLYYVQDVSNRSRDQDVMTARFEAAVNLHHFKEAWDAAMMLKSAALWQQLAEAHLHNLDVGSAIRYMLMYLHNLYIAVQGKYNAYAWLAFCQSIQHINLHGPYNTSIYMVNTIPACFL